MGNQNYQKKIVYKCGAQYNGQIMDEKANGYGTISFSEKHDLLTKGLKRLKKTQNGKLIAIKGQFKQGKLVKAMLDTETGFSYQGQVNQNGQLSGKATLTDKDDVVYQGVFQKGKMVKGRIQDSQNRNKQNQNRIAYICETEGQFIGTSILNGKGIYQNLTDGYIAIGEFYKGKLIKGLYQYENGDVYEGEFSQGSPNGFGIYWTANFVKNELHKGTSSESAMKKYSSQIQKKINQVSRRSSQQQKRSHFVYEGNFIAKQFSGKGKISFQNNQEFQGHFKNGTMNGYGQYKYSDGTIYKGDYYFGSMTGQATILYSKKSEINKGKKAYQIIEKYYGQVKQGVFHGLGILYFENGIIFKGYFLEGAKNGPGIIIYCQDKYKCLYIMNKLVGGMKKLTEELYN